MPLPKGLKPARELAEGRPHGDRIRYMGGCRCDCCRRANTEYEKARAGARKAGEWNGLVSSERAHAHVLELRKKGVGRRQISDAAGVSETVMFKVASGKRSWIRALTERRILAVTSAAAADRALVSARPTWRLLDELLVWGYTKAHLARELGNSTPALQVGRRQVTARTAYEVQQLHARLRRVPVGPTENRLADLRAEGYSEARLQVLLVEIADRLGKAVPDLRAPRGYVDATAADLVKQLHEELTGEAFVPRRRTPRSAIGAAEADCHFAEAA